MASIPVGDDPYYLAYDGTYVWATIFNSGQVKKIDPNTNSVVGSYSVGSTPSGILFDGTSIWVSTVNPGDLIQLRPSDGVQLNSIHVGSDPKGMAFDGSHVWVAQSFGGQNGGGQVSKVRVSDGTIVGSYSTGAGTRDVAFDGQNIWAANFWAGTITRIRASDGQVLETIPGAGRPQALASDGTAVWVGYADHQQNQQPGQPELLQRFAISDGSLTGEVSSDSVLDLAFDGEYVWSSSQIANNVSKYRASDGQKLGQFQPNNGNGQSYGVAHADGHVWVANPGPGANDVVTKVWPD